MISNQEIDKIYEYAMKNGSTGGKVSGAGGERDFYILLSRHEQI